MEIIGILKLMMGLVGWPVLIIGSIYLFIKGKSVFSLVKGSLVGKITKALVFTMVLEMYSLGFLITIFVLTNELYGVLIGLPFFIAWYFIFLWCVHVLENAKDEVDKLMK